MKTPSHHHSMLYVLILLLCFAASFIVNTDARKLNGKDNGPLLVSQNSEDIKPSEINGLRRFDVYLPSEDSSNSGPYGVSSPFNLPPYDSLPPVPNTPPFCLNPPSPFTLQPPPSGSSSSGGGPIVNLPPTPSSTIIPTPPQQYLPPIIIPNPPQYYEPSPPTTTVPTPTGPVFSPPYYYEPSPPSYYDPSTPPTGPSPPTGLFLPPVIYPPPAVPPPPHIAPATALWCVAKPSVPDPIIQEAMNYACSSGANCDQINPSGSCFQPNTLFAHASYAFNSYWQRTKVAGGTCEFGGTAMLVTVDPSYDGCQFNYNEWMI